MVSFHDIVNSMAANRVFTGSAAVESLAIFSASQPVADIDQTDIQSCVRS
jgi:hypothetical protein